MRAACTGARRRHPVTASALVVAVLSLVLACERPLEPQLEPIPDAEIPALYEALTDGDTAAEEKAIAEPHSVQ